MRYNHTILSVALMVTLADVSHAKDRYYMLVFGSQTEPFSIRFTHTFAMFVKASGDGDNPRTYQLQTQTISWMPQTLSIRVLASSPEPGVNLSIADSLQWAQSVGAVTTVWGPFEIRQELYERAAKQAARLNAGEALYLCNDRRHRGTEATNCIHAVSDVETSEGLLMTGRQCGNAGSGAVIQHFAGHIVSNESTDRWLCEKLKIAEPEVRFALPDDQPQKLVMK